MIIEQFIKKWNMGEGYTHIINDEGKEILKDLTHGEKKPPDVKSSGYNHKPIRQTK